jgi:hypothetical protein
MRHRQSGRIRLNERITLKPVFRDDRPGLVLSLSVYQCHILRLQSVGTRHIIAQGAELQRHLWLSTGMIIKALQVVITWN